MFILLVEFIYSIQRKAAKGIIFVSLNHSKYYIRKGMAGLYYQRVSRAMPFSTGFTLLSVFYVRGTKCGYGPIFFLLLLVE
jgi:hypothetical protein